MVGPITPFAFALSFFLLHALAQHTHPNEVSTLYSIRDHLVDPNKHLRNWGRGDPCLSNWTGVTCYDKLRKDGYRHIRELQLFTMNLSGTIAPEIGQLSHLEILNFMWNQISGDIPKQIGNLSSLTLLLLNGNNLSGSMPDELGNLSKLNRLQLDENNISGEIPRSFANMKSIEHFHLNNNSISGQVPSELSQCSRLIHILVDNNNLFGDLPRELSALKRLQILKNTVKGGRVLTARQMFTILELASLNLSTWHVEQLLSQLDNNHLIGGSIPESYQNMSGLVKLSLRNCSLAGMLPDFRNMPNLTYIDLSLNQFTGTLPSNKLSANVTTIILSHNKLSGLIPESFSNFPSLQLLALENNSLNGSVPAGIWQNKSFNATARLLVDLRYNHLSDVSGDLIPPNVTLRLRGNPVCNSTNILNIGRFCISDLGANGTSDPLLNLNSTCPPHACPESEYYEAVPAAPTCFCAAPIRIGYRLKSPSFTYFPPFKFAFETYITRTLDMELYQLNIDSIAWEEGPRLRMYLKLYPSIKKGNMFNETELYWIRNKYIWWQFPGNELFGPYELLNFTLLGPYSSVDLDTGKGGLSKGVLAGILVAAVIFAAAASAVVTLFILRRKKKVQFMSKKNLSSKISVKIDGVKAFMFKEMSEASSNFIDSTQIGQGGYGKVYRGVLSDNTIVAIKRAEEGSLQGTREFLTEIQLLSRLHHRNLVSLIGYCDEDGEQMLVYEYVSNGTLRDWLSGKHEKTLNFVMRLRIALGAAKGILYLHTEANPPIFHRDIKATNILLDSHLMAKVADFGLSRLAPVMDDEGSASHYVSTVVKGTPGYLDPEYLLTHKLTDKSDVYSLGVVLLELLTGVPPISHGKNIVREVNIAKQSGTMFEIIDKRMGAYPSECIERFMGLGVRCCDDKPEMRPSMLEVVRELENLVHMVPQSMSMSESEIISKSSSVPQNSSSSSTSFANVPKYARMSSDVSGSDLTTTIIPSITPR